MSALLTADWSSFGKDNYMRKFEVYSIWWPDGIHIEDYKVTSARYGGPVAFVRNKSKFVEIRGKSKMTIYIFTSSGRLISQFEWKSGQLLQVGWSSTLDLLCVQDDGRVLVYDMFSGFQDTITMGQEALDSKVIDARIFYNSMGTGIAVLTAAHRVFLMNSIQSAERKIRKLSDVPGSSRSPVSWVVLCEERHSKVLFARNKDIYLLNETDPKGELKHIRDSSFNDENYSIINMQTTSNYELLAILTDTGKVWIGTSNLQHKYRVFDTRNTEPPSQMVWCGADAVLLNRDEDLEVIGLIDEHLVYNYETPTLSLVQERDCARVFSALSMEIIQKVPSVVKEVLNINSKSPGSYLLEASKQFQKRSPRANEYLHLVKNKLATAVRLCIDAAGFEFNPETQKMLMRAAAFGKTFLDDNNPEIYTDMCRLLRCLNDVRRPQIGIPITQMQLVELTVKGFLDLLMYRRLHFLSLEYSNFLKQGYATKIVSDWSCCKVKQPNINKDQVAMEIAEKQVYAKGLSYATIARKAAECKRTELAIKLLEYEPQANLQVNLLMDLGEHRAALVKAVESGNTDLVYLVLSRLRPSENSMHMEIRPFPLAQSLYLQYCRLYNREGLKVFYGLEDHHESFAECLLREAYDATNAHTHEVSIIAACEKYKIGKNLFNASLCEDQVKLLKHQRAWESTFGSEYVGLSLQDTLTAVLKAGKMDLVNLLKSEFKISDRKYWWVRIKVLAELDDWTELERFSKSKRSPIGYEPFLDVCIEHLKQYEAQKYLPKVKEELKVKYLVKLGKLSEAIEVAFEQKNESALAYVKTKCDAALAEKCNAYIKQLSRK